MLRTLIVRLLYKEFIEGELRINKLTATDKKTLEEFTKKINMKLMDMGKYKSADTCEISDKYRDILNDSSISLDKEILKKEIYQYLNSHNTCALGTGYKNKIRITPIEYIFNEDKLYFMTEGGHKFFGVLQNSYVSIAVYDEYKGFNQLKGLQISGIANILKVNSPEYVRIMNLKGIKYKNLPIDMNIIEVSPKRYEFLNSDFKNMNVDAKQVLDIG